MTPTTPAANNAKRLRLLATAVCVSAGVLTVSLGFSRQPLTAPLSTVVEMKDMSWVEVRSALAAGHTTAIVPTGGIEQNGPHMILGKHDYIVAEAARKIAADVGRTLVAPIVSYVPEGDYDPPTGHMRFPGTLGVPEAIFAGVLEGIARSLKAAGFKTICFIGDHGQSQAMQAAVAEKLTREWAKDGVRVAQIDAYYDDKAQIGRLLSEGHSRAAIGEHASLIDSSELMSIYPKGVDLASYVRTIKSSEFNGVNGDPRAASGELGEKLLAMRVAAAAAQIRALQPTR